MYEENWELAEVETFKGDLDEGRTGEAVADDASRCWNVDGEGNVKGKGEDERSTGGRWSESSSPVGSTISVDKGMSRSGVDGAASIFFSTLGRM